MLALRSLSAAALAATLTLGGLAMATPTATAGSPGLSATLSDSSVKPGDRVVMRGSAGSTDLTSKVRLQKRVEQNWRLVKAVEPTGNEYRVSFKAEKGRTLYRVVSKAEGQRVQSSKMAVRAKSQTELQQVRSMILRQTNKYRADAGLKPLKLKAGVNSVAQKWSVRMARSGEFKHNPNYSSQMPKGWRGAAENIAAGYEPKAVVKGWFNSPGHKANMLGDYTHIGIGYAKKADSPYGRYYTQNFGKY